MQMVNKLLAFSAFLLILSGGYYTSYAQNVQGSRYLPIDYSVIISAEFLNKLDPYVPVTKREKEQAQRFMKQFEQEFMDECYEKLSQEISSHAGIQLMALETARNYVDFNDKGYPFVLFPKKKIKKINSQEVADYFVSLKVNLSVAGGLSPKLALSGAFKPEVEVVAIFRNQQAEKVKQVNKVVVATTPIKGKDFQGGKFDKMEMAYVDLLMEKIRPTFAQAIQEASEELK